MNPALEKILKPSLAKIFAPERLPLLSTIVICLIMYISACCLFPNFFTASQSLNFFRNSVYVGIAAVGVTFVIISGGIDLSVGAAVGFSSVLYAKLVVQHDFNPVLGMPVILLLTCVVGAGMGAIIHFFRVPPFLITLAGMFLYRGLALIITTDQIPADIHLTSMIKYFDWMLRPESGNGKHQLILSFDMYVLIALFLAGFFLQTWSTWGRSMFAIGGSEQSALLMGLPVARNRIIAYAFSGLCGGFAGIVHVVNGSGYALHGSGLELDAITVVVIGGTLLTGGYGSIVGTIFGLLTCAIIEEAVSNRDLIKSHPSAWLPILKGALLLTFILLQKLLTFLKHKKLA